MPVLLATLVAAASDPPVVPPICSNHSDLSTYPTPDGKCTSTIATVAEWERRRDDILVGVQAMMGSLPPQHAYPPLDLRIESTRTTSLYARHEISYVAERDDQLRATGLLFVPTAAPGGGRKFPTALALHPTSPDGARWSETRHPPLDYAVELASRGYVVIAPDYPEMGRQAAFNCTKLEVAGGHPSCSIKGVIIHARAIDVLEGLPYADTSKLVAIGHSLGGHNAIFIGLFDERVKVIVSSCGWTPWSYYTSHMPLNASWAQPKYMPRIASIYGGDPKRIPTDFYEMVAALAPRPFFSNSPYTDFNFNVSGVWTALPQLHPVWARYAAAANESAGDESRGRLHVTFPAGGCAIHTFASSSGSAECGHDFPDGTRLAAYEFIERQLK